MPENMRSTLTLSGSDSMYTSTLTIFLYKSYIMAIFKYSGPSHLENYARVIVFKPDLYRSSFYDCHVRD